MRRTVLQIALLSSIVFFTIYPLCAQGTIRFRDITDFAGVGDLGWGVGSALADFNNDGLVDIYLCNGDSPNRLYKNINGVQFQDIAASAGVADPNKSMDCAWGDINNDGYLDLFVASQYHPSRLFLNLGDETFQDITYSSGIVVNGAAQSPSFCDADGDGDLDLYLTNDQSWNYFFFNNGDNTFTDSTAWSCAPGRGASFSGFFSDINNDSIPDLYVTSRYMKNIMYLGIGNGQFWDATNWSNTLCSINGTSSILFDYDNDGDLDLYAVNSGNYECDSFYRNDGGGQFENITYQALISDNGYGRGVMCGDFNHDGFQDVIINMDTGNTKVYQNNGNGTFSDVTATSGIAYCEEPTSCSIADIDGDGDLDLYISDKCMKNKMLLNRCNDQNFLRIKLVGSISNRFGIGSKIYLYDQNDSLLQYRELCVGKARLAMCEPVAHFGTAYGPLYKVRVVFPSGIIVDSTNVAAAQTITIFEGPPGAEETEWNGTCRPPQLTCVGSNLVGPYHYELLCPQHTEIKSIAVYNILGRRTAVPRANISDRGRVQIVWNGLVDNTASAPRGMYVLRIEIISENGQSSTITAKILKLSD